MQERKGNKQTTEGNTAKLSTVFILGKREREWLLLLLSSIFALWDISHFPTLQRIFKEFCSEYKWMARLWSILCSDKLEGNGSFCF